MDEGNKQTAPPLALLVTAAHNGANPYERLLSRAGCVVVEASTGRLALEQLRRMHPDIVVLDADIADMPPLELCGALRADPQIASGTPILIVALRASTREERLAALRAGAWEWLPYPPDDDEALLRIGALMRALGDAGRTQVEGLLDPVTGLYNWQGLARRARELGAQAFRQHEALACIALAIDLDPNAPPHADGAHAALVGCAQALKSTARLSDVIGRLGPSEFALIAPATDAAGAVKLAERLRRRIESKSPVTVRVRAGYDAVANVGYTPIEPVDLLSRASAALRRARSEPGANPGR